MPDGPIESDATAAAHLPHEDDPVDLMLRILATWRTRGLRERTKQAEVYGAVDRAVEALQVLADQQLNAVGSGRPKTFDQ
jgi:hypothetical protein